MKKNKMFVFKKSQIVTMALISILVVAGYLNYSKIPEGSGEAKEASAVLEKEINELPPEEEEEPEKYGEARFVSAAPEKDEAKLRVEKERSRAMEIYREIAESGAADAEQKKSAAAKAERIADAITHEANIESVLAGKGFSDAIVTVGEENVYVSITGENPDSDCLFIIQNAVMEETGIRSDKIRVNVR